MANQLKFKQHNDHQRWFVADANDSPFGVLELGGSVLWFIPDPDKAYTLDHLAEIHSFMQQKKTN